MEFEGKRIPELDPNPLLSDIGMFPWYDPVTDTTYRISAAEFLSGLYSPDDAWNAEAEYPLGSLVTFQTELWILTDDDPAHVGSPPGPDSLYWTLEPDPEPVGGGGWPLFGAASFTGSVDMDMNGNEFTLFDIVSNEYSSFNIGSGSVNLGVGDQTTLSESSFNLGTESLRFSAKDSSMMDGIVLRLDTAIGAYLNDPSGNGIELYAFDEVSPNGSTLLTLQPAFSQLSADTPDGDICYAVLTLNANSGESTLTIDSDITLPYSFVMNYLNGFTFRQGAFDDLVTVRETYGLAIHGITNGLAQQSPDGNWWKLEISDLGIVSASLIGVSLP